MSAFDFDEELLSERLRIRTVARSDLSGLLDIHRVDIVQRYLPSDTWQDISDAEQWYAKAEERHRERSARQLVIRRRSDDRVLGSAILFNYQTEQNAAEIGYVIGQPYWRQGYMREALQLLVELAFGALELEALTAKVVVDNRASIGLLKQQGFKETGLFSEGEVELLGLRLARP